MMMLEDNCLLISSSLNKQSLNKQSKHYRSYIEKAAGITTSWFVKKTKKCFLAKSLFRQQHSIDNMHNAVTGRDISFEDVG